MYLLGFWKKIRYKGIEYLKYKDNQIDTRGIKLHESQYKIMGELMGIEVN